MTKIRICAILSFAMLAGCEPQQPQAVPAPPPSPEATAPAATPPAPSTETAPAPAAADPATAPSAPADSAATAPAPTAATTGAQPTPIESMALARPSGKMSVAVDLRYQVGPIVAGQPVTLQLAAVPRVAGDNLKVEIPPATGVTVSRGTLSAQKADAGGVYRQQYSLTPRAGAPRELSVLVTMDMPEGTAFGFFAVPLDGGNTAQKSDSVKQR